MDDIQQACPGSSDIVGHCGGMTLLDWLAGQALVGLAAWQWGDKENPGAIDTEAMAATTVALAQDVLKELDHQQGRKNYE